MKIFEIPYNFDKNLIDELIKIDPTGNLYHSIYIPPYYDDYFAAKRNYIHSAGNDMQIQQNIKRSEYESHISYIKHHFPDKLMLLLQQNNMCIDKQLLQYYINLGFTKFCVGNIQQAIEIREICPNSEIIASITMKIMPKDLEKPEYNIFDGIVLWFPYNRKLSVIKSLPQNHKYILLVNCDCNIYCDGTHHWFASRKVEENNYSCPNKNGKRNWINQIRIHPWDLPIFEPYITYFKLQGREFTTNYLINDIKRYTKEYNIISTEDKYENINFHFPLIT